jgi:hypothetical protein
MNHTPGPWKVHKHPHIRNELWLSVLHGAWDITHNSAADPGVIADAKYSAMSDEENLANAHLIAAAPDLLEALKNMCDLMDRIHGDAMIGKPIRKQARAAIAKAESD